MSRREEILRERSYSVDVDVSTGGDIELPVAHARYTSKVQRYVIIPRAAFTAHATNNWTLKLKDYDEFGAETQAVPRSIYTLDERDLVVGLPIVVPFSGFFGWRFMPGHSLTLDVEEGGTAADLDCRVQVDCVIGGR